MNRHSFALFPALDRRHVAAEVVCDVLPGVQAAVGRHRRWSFAGGGFVHHALPVLRGELYRHVTA